MYSVLAYYTNGSYNGNGKQGHCAIAMQLTRTLSKGAISCSHCSILTAVYLTVSARPSTTVVLTRPKVITHTHTMLTSVQKNNCYRNRNKTRVGFPCQESFMSSQPLSTNGNYSKLLLRLTLAMQQL